VSLGARLARLAEWVGGQVVKCNYPENFVAQLSKTYTTIIPRTFKMSHSLYNGIFLSSEAAARLSDISVQIAFDVFKPVFLASADDKTYRDCLEAVVTLFPQTVFEKLTRQISRRHVDFENIIRRAVRELAFESIRMRQNDSETTKRIASVGSSDLLAKAFVKDFLIALSKESSLRDGSFFETTNFLSSTLVSQRCTRSTLWNIVDEHVRVETTDPADVSQKRRSSHHKKRDRRKETSTRKGGSRKGKKKPVEEDEDEEDEDEEDEEDEDGEGGEGGEDGEDGEDEDDAGGGGGGGGGEKLETATSKCEENLTDFVNDNQIGPSDSVSMILERVSQVSRARSETGKSSTKDRRAKHRSASGRAASTV